MASNRATTSTAEVVDPRGQVPPPARQTLPAVETWHDLEQAAVTGVAKVSFHFQLHQSVVAVVIFLADIGGYHFVREVAVMTVELRLVGPVRDNVVCVSLAPGSRVGLLDGPLAAARAEIAVLRRRPVVGVVPLGRRVVACHTHRDGDGLDSHDLACDACGACYPHVTDAHHDWRLLCDEASTAGWSAPPGGPHHCPTCQPAPMIPSPRTPDRGARPGPRRDLRAIRTGLRKSVGVGVDMSSLGC